MRPAIFSGRGRASARTEPTLPNPPTDQGTGETPAPDPGTAEIMAEAVATWRRVLLHENEPSPLSDLTVLGDNCIDLSAAHPSGLAQFYAGRPTPLSNIVREPQALAKARSRAKAVRLGAEEFAARYGLPPAHLAIGVASWRSDPDGALGPLVRVHLPVLLRPVTITAHGKQDMDLTLEPEVEVNPVLVAALKQAGVHVDADALAAAAFVGNSFDPNEALSALTELGREALDDFALRDQLLVATFHHPDQMLLDDLDAASGWVGHPVIAALAGAQAAVDALRSQVLPPWVPGDRAPQAERGIGDLDPDEQYVLDAVATGCHLFIDAAPGAPVPQTVAAIIADATASGRTVLYVAGNRRAARLVRAELDKWGAGDLVLDLDAQVSWQSEALTDLLGGFNVPIPEIDSAAVAAVRRSLVESRSLLDQYLTGLHVRRDPWGVSAYEALQALADTTAVRPAPRTTVRLDVAVTQALIGERRQEARLALMRCAQLGGFTLRPQDTPWYGADIDTDAAAKDALETLARLRGNLPLVIAQMRKVAADTGLAAATTLEGWGEQLDMLAGIRQALDIFLPVLFEHSAHDMVAATATKAWRVDHGIEMGSMQRSRLRKQARDLVRPGVHVPDLHAALEHAEQQRVVWTRWAPQAAWPKLPDGMAGIDAAYREVAADVRRLEPLIAPTPVGGDFMALPVDELTARLDRLAAAGDALHTLPERTRLLRWLDAAGLGPLVEDLSTRRAVAGSILLGDDAIALIGSELDLAWWSSVLQAILQADPVLAGFDGGGLAGLTQQFIAADLGQLATLPGPVLAAVFTRLAQMAEAHPDQVTYLLNLTGQERGLSPRRIYETCPDLAMRLRPCWMTGPMLVPQVVPPKPVVDMVIMDAAQHLDVARAVASIGRGKQLVLVGDDVRGSDGVVGALAGVLPQVPLKSGVSRRDPRLTRFLLDHGYDGLLDVVPLPATDTDIVLHLIEGTGLPTQGGTAVESVPPEVDAVVELVAQHAARWPDHTLAVVTPSRVHAERVRQAVESAASHDVDLRLFLAARRKERFVVTDIDQCAGLSRDAVIFSLGFGKTPHGKVIHNFGEVSVPGGDARLLDALIACRGRLDVVTCIAAEDLDPKRLTRPGVRLLSDLLTFAADPRDPELPQPPPDEESLLTELADRLVRMGLIVERNYTGHGGKPISMAVGHPLVDDRLLVAVLSDDLEFSREPSVRMRVRLRAARLEALGWTVHQVWAAAIFLDADAEAAALEDVVVAAARRARPDLADQIVPAPYMPGEAGEEPLQWPSDAQVPDAGTDAAEAATDTASGQEPGQ